MGSELEEKPVEPPNFRDEDGKLYVVRCPECKRENYALAVAGGRCCWCGWGESEKEEE